MVLSRLKTSGLGELNGGDLIHLWNHNILPKSWCAIVSMRRACAAAKRQPPCMSAIRLQFRLGVLASPERLPQY